MRIEASSLLRQPRWTACLSTLAALAALSVCIYARARDTSQSTSTSQQTGSQVSQMLNYAKQGHYDEAIQVGLQIAKSDPRDEVAYQQISDVYLMRAQKDQNQRELWVAKAASYLQQALSFNSKDTDAAGVNLFQDARGFEVAGDLSTGEKCVYYQKSITLLEERVSSLQGDKITLAGRTFPLEPLRKENDKVLAGAKDKASKAGCNWKN